MYRSREFHVGLTEFAWKRLQFLEKDEFYARLE
jgi:hypothetical protein